MTDAGFYRAFEDKYRGPRELIRSRLEVYKPFILPLLGLYQPARAIDLGCGRGEWLEIIRDSGFESRGIDLDEGMLSACVERGLPVLQGDGIEYLKTLSDESQCIVSGFHVAEHIPYEALVELIVQAQRVLQPGGLLILETPNPENLVVGTCNFYLDPTHTRPIPPVLLSFLAEHQGYGRVRVLRLQEDSSLHDCDKVELIDVLGGVSPDYAIVAQKKATPEIMEKFETAFAADYGVELRQLADRYDIKINRKVQELTQRLSTVESQTRNLDSTFLAGATELQEKWIAAIAEHARLDAKACAAEYRAEKFEALMQQAKDEIEEVEMRLHEALNVRDHYSCVAEENYRRADALENSLSWKITSPLRRAYELKNLLKRFISWLFHSARTTRVKIKKTLWNNVQRIFDGVQASPRLKRSVLGILNRNPRLMHAIRSFYFRSKVMNGKDDSQNGSLLNANSSDYHGCRNQGGDSVLMQNANRVRAVGSELRTPLESYFSSSGGEV